MQDFGKFRFLNSGERIPRQLRCGVSEQNTKKVLYGIGFLVSLLRGVSISPPKRVKFKTGKI